MFVTSHRVVAGTESPKSLSKLTGMTVHTIYKVLKTA